VDMAGLYTIRLPQGAGRMGGPCVSALQRTFGGESATFALVRWHIRSLHIDIVSNHSGHTGWNNTKKRGGHKQNWAGKTNLFSGKLTD